VRILHYSDGDSGGGAGRAAFRLHRALREAGVQSRMVVLDKRSEDEDVDWIHSRSFLRPPPSSPWRWRARRVRARLTPSRPKPPSLNLFHYDAGPTTEIAFEDLRRAPRGAVDIVYFHHVRRLLTVDLMRAIMDFYGCPAVQILHTHAPFTGGCNFTLGCERFTASCGACPELSSTDEHDLSRVQWQHKRAVLGSAPLAFVTPGTDTAGLARTSSLFHEHEVVTIPHAVDARVFDLGDQAAARHALRIPQDARVICTSAVGWQNRYKGTDDLLAALRRIAETLEESRASTFLLVVGSGGERLLESQPFPGLALGLLNDDLALALVFRSADVLVCSSRAETGPQTIPEAMLCGTPAAAFPVGAVPDFVRHGETGYIAQAGDSDDLARGIETVLGWNHDRGRAERCREAALGTSYDRVAARHLDLCESLLSSGAAPPIEKR
jgi:glycosyltransferase involved in cell wall biosynthesis